MIKYLLPLCLVLAPNYGWAASLDSALLACKDIVDNTQRLACFDQIQVATIAQAVEPEVIVTAKKLTVEPEPIATVKKPAVQTEADFGLEHKAVAQEALPESAAVVLTKVTKTPFGLLIFNFDNGQVWRQIAKETYLTNIGKNYVLERGALNSFFLREEGKSMKTRVRRDK